MTNTNSEMLNWTPEWIANWHEWKRTFEEATRVDEKLGLLRIGFHVSMGGRNGEPDYKLDERICYYLRLANGHCNSFHMHVEGEGDISSHTRMRTPHGDVERLSELRLLVARAAFNTLAINFFKSKAPRSRIDMYPDWARALFEGDTLKELMRFFRIAPGAYTTRRTLVNFPDKFYEGNRHNGELARKFLDDLFRFAWQFRHFGSYRSSQDQDYRKRLDRIKPYLVQIMTYTDRTWWLLRPDFPISDACMRILERFTLTWEMRRQMPIHNSEERRNAATVEEAAADGCQTAQAVLLLRNRRREHARLEEICEAKRKAEELECRVRTLQE